MNRTIRLLATSMFLCAAAGAAFAEQEHHDMKTMEPPQAAGDAMGCPMMGAGMKHGKGDGPEGKMEGMMEGMGGGMMGMMGMAAPEERLALMKTNLSITAAQEGAWEGYASAFKVRADTMKKNRELMMKGMQSGSAVSRLDNHITAMQAMVDALKQLKPATEVLYAALSDEQKKKADTMLAGGCMK